MRATSNKSDILPGLGKPAAEIPTNTTAAKYCKTHLNSCNDNDVSAMSEITNSDSLPV
jgi:hypothetical protein